MTSITGALHEDMCTFMIICRSIHHEMSQTKVAEKIKTHILWSITFFFINRAVYEIMWTNMAEPDRSQMTI
jgi:hypothetical protein